MRSLNHRLKYGMIFGLFGLVTFCTQPTSAAQRDACCNTSTGGCTNVTPFCTNCNSPDVCNSTRGCSNVTSVCKVSDVCINVNDACWVETCGLIPASFCRLTSTGVCTRVHFACHSECAGPAFQCILYVDAAATGADDGSSWADAYSKLQDALDDAVADDEIWVAEGTYYPDEGASVTDNDRDASFVMVNGLEIYGGFDGTETARTGRDPAANVTILSGDIKQDDGTALTQAECESSAYDAKGWDTDADPDVCLYVHEVREGYADVPVTTEFFCTGLNGGEWDANHDTQCYLVSRQCSGGSAPGTICQDDADCAGSGTCVAYLEQFKNADNSIHVVTVGKNVNNVVVDGFTITAGNANRKGCVGGADDGNICLVDSDCDGAGNDCEHDLVGQQGGGIINRDVDGPATAINNDLTVRDCIFDGNNSRNHGAFNDHGTDTIIDDCVFKNNITGVRGGGLYTHNDSDATVTDCTFSDNYAGYRGGGMYVNSDATTASAVTVSDCLFENNEVFDYAGGLNCATGAVVTVTDCEFRGNSAIAPYGSGGAIWTQSGTIDVTDCIFERNTGVRVGAVSLGSTDSTFTGCAFWQNVATGDGSIAGAISLDTLSSVIDECDFVENQAADNGAVVSTAEQLTVINSRFVLNTATNLNGGGLTITNSASPDSTELTNCVFVGNDGVYGGGIFAVLSDFDAVNCLFVRNESISHGGAIVVLAGTAAIVNSTIADNVADSDDQWDGLGGGILNTGTLTVDNCILWGNTDEGTDDEDAQLTIAGLGEATVTYTDWSGHSGGTGNIDDNPDFIGSVETGTWTSVAAYDPNTGTTTFTNTSGGWTLGEFVDLVLQPDTSVEDYTIVTANNAHTITALGEFSSCSSSCSSFDIVDYRLDDAGNPSTNSPCIDTGDDDALPADTQDLDGDSNTTEAIPYDLDGVTRVVDSETSSEDVDMGCYEIQ